MFVKLDDTIVDILCCPLCKGIVETAGEKLVCKDCGSKYYKCSVAQGRHEDRVFDFRIHRPSYCIPPTVAEWAGVQEEYRGYHSKRRAVDDMTVYLDEIDSVKEIYTKEFDIKGKILDVGGGHGRLRHFLKDNEITLYVSIDPYPELFQDLESRPNFLKAYPCLRKPCNFLSCYAEHLPFVKNTFDWVHMRSVLDHFQDPYLALKEAYRVLKAGGTLLIGSGLRSGQSSVKEKGGSGGLTDLARKAVRRALNKKEKTKQNDHMFHWIYEDVIDLVKTSGFSIVREHWQKPPFSDCIYLSAKKRVN